MSLINFIEKLQKKPRHVKVQIMWVAVAVCMFFIFAFWLWSLGNLNASITKSADEEKISGTIEQLKKDVPSLWQSLGAGIGNVFESVKQELQNQPQATTPSATSEPGQERLPIE